MTTCIAQYSKNVKLENEKEDFIKVESKRDNEKEKETRGTEMMATVNFMLQVKEMVLAAINLGIYFSANIDMSLINVKNNNDNCVNDNYGAKEKIGKNIERINWAV